MKLGRFFSHEERQITFSGSRKIVENMSKTRMKMGGKKGEKVRWKNQIFGHFFVRMTSWKIE